MILKWILNSAALLLVSWLFPGVLVENFYAALIIALVLGLLNAFLRPVLFFLTLPLTIATLGIFSLVLNGILFWFASTFIKGFEVHGLLTAIFASIVYTFLSNAVDHFVEKHGE